MRGVAVAAALLLLGHMPVGFAHPDDGLWFLEDPADDQRLVPTGYVRSFPLTDNLPGADLATTVPVADLRKVTIGGEDSIGFSLDFQVQRLTVGTLTPPRWTYCPDASAGTGGYAAKLEARFAFDAREYLAGVHLYGTWEGTPPVELRVLNAIACVVQVEGGAARGPAQRVDLTLDDAGDRLHLFIPKSSLTGERRVPPGVGGPWYNAKSWPLTVPVGSQLTGLQAAGYAEIGRTDVGWAANTAYVIEDRLDPASKAFTFERPMANGIIHLRLEEGAPRLPIRPGVNQTLEVRVTNFSPGKRIVSFDYALIGPDDTRPLYRLFGPSRATVPAGESRIIQIALDVAPGAGEGDNVTADVRAASVGYPDEVGFAEALLVPGPSLGPAENVLFLQSRAGCTGDGPTNQAYRNAQTTLYPGSCQYTFLSSKQDDPQSSGEKEVRVTCFPNPWNPGNIHCSLYSWTLGAGVATPLHFDPAGRLRFELDFRPGFQALAAPYRAEIAYFNDTGRSMTLADWEGTIDIKGQSTKVLLEAPVGLKDPVLPRGTRLRAYFAFDFPPSEGGARAAADNGMILLLEKSRLTLPLLPPPAPPHAATLDHPLQLMPLGAREDFINPGKARLFNLTVFNQGGRAYEATLHAEVARPGWSVELVPGAKFTLEPGDTIRIGALVRAPARAADGDEASVRVVVDDGAGRTSNLTLNAVVVQAIDVGNDVDRYEADSEAQAKLVTPPQKKTPGPSIAFVVVGALGLAWIRRRV